MPSTSSVEKNLRVYNRILLLVAGLGGLLYGIDVGIIGGALPYLQATSKLYRQRTLHHRRRGAAGQRLLHLFAGLLADWMGRKPLMILSGVAFVLSIPVIALSQGYGPLVLRASAAGRQRRPSRHGGAALPG